MPVGGAITAQAQRVVRQAVDPHIDCSWCDLHGGMQWGSEAQVHEARGKQTCALTLCERVQVEQQGGPSWLQHGRGTQRGIVAAAHGREGRGGWLPGAKVGIMLAP